MPRQDAVWLNLQVSQEEKDILTEYAHSNRKSRVEVVREFIRGLKEHPREKGSRIHRAVEKAFESNDPWADFDESFDDFDNDEEGLKIDQMVAEVITEAWGQFKAEPEKLIKTKEEVREWIDSICAESDQELTDAKSLRAMAAHMLTIANRLEK